MKTFNEAHETLITAAVGVYQRIGDRKSEWGPREVLAHIMGWEAEATARIPVLAEGQLPITYLDDTFNAAVITAIGKQSFDEVCGLLRQTHQRLIAVLSALDDIFFVEPHPIHTRVVAMTHHSTTVPLR